MNKSRQLYLVRHAKSSWKDNSLADIDRPLNKRGRRTSPEMGQRLATQGHHPDLIISSPANRARTTACNIARELGTDESEINIDNDLYFSGTGGLLNVLERVDDRYRSVMLFGHNPTMTDMMNRLSGARVYNMPTCAIAIIGFDMPSWDMVRTSEGTLLGYDYPKGSGRFSPDTR
ncbi:MAG TPA: histidine phosphatase family protein [Xanthomonadales bacterium]|nr:histidine phosphatase family protein [Xanthomonadales bacterium]